MINLSRVEHLCNVLIEEGLMDEGQKKEVLIKWSTQEKRILLEKRTELRKLLGRQRITYEVTEIELISSFQFLIPRTNNILTEQIVTEISAKDAGLPFIFIDPLSLDFNLVTSIFPGPYAERHMVIPLKLEDNTLTVAIADPYNVELIENLRRVTGKSIKCMVSSKSDILKIITEFYGFKKSVTTAATQFDRGVDFWNLEQYVKMKAISEIVATDKPIIQAVWYLFNYALDQRASDIHIEPKRDICYVRLRIDGVLHKVHEFPKVVHPAITSRIKMLARMDIAEKRRPQDGRIKTTYKGNEVELRVSTIPTAFGEKSVIRIFDPSVLLHDLCNLGFFEKELKLFEQFISHTHGLILITGPTGSGKTTTLYSTLNYLSSPFVNITTIEDPIEMVFENFNQMAIQPKIGFDFAHAIRSLMRQDPDIIMVGEIRDPDTAENAIQAALTGHLVFSTLHTNDTSTAITRMLDLKVLPYLLSSTLIGVVAQRLVRKICQNCAMETYLTDEEIRTLNIPLTDGQKLKVKYGAGCPICRGTGYFGRTGIFEIMPITPRIQELIKRQAPATEIKREALADGMMTLREYAIKKMAKGITTFDEVIRVTGGSEF